MSGATTRAHKAGKAQGEAVVETIHLFYQNNTALAYIRALCLELDAELERREKSLLVNKK